MNSTILRAGISCAICSALMATGVAQSRFATSVVSFNPGANSGAFDATRALGGPRALDFSTGTLSLGMGGDLTLGFDLIITDGPGADFTVYENPFDFNGGVFAEVAMVEVSTNGIDFARFPQRYDGPQGPLGSFDVLAWGSYSGMTGAVPTLADVVSNTLDPFNPVESGGDAFDLADLLDHPLVLSNLVDLLDIRYVRIVDMIAGTEMDSRLVTIWDSGGANGSADIDAVAIINDTTSVNPTGPTADFWRDDLGYVWLEVSDPDGRADLDIAGLRLSANLIETPFYRLRNYFTLTQLTTTGFTLRSPLPVFLEDFELVLGISVSDLAGNQCVDQIALNR